MKIDSETRKATTDRFAELLEMEDSLFEYIVGANEEGLLTEESHVALLAILAFADENGGNNG